MSKHQLVSAWRAAPLAEIAWLDPDGRPDAATVVPLVHRDRPALALTFDRLDLGRRLAGAEAVLFSVTSPALGGGGSPVSAWAHVSVHEDLRGTEFEEHFLNQELAKHPPARRFVDSPLLRAEHPWYLPRILVRVTRIEEVTTHPFRDALAVTTVAGHGCATTVDLDRQDREAAVTSPLPDGPTTILQHGADIPDLDRPWWRRWRGDVRDGVLATAEYDERVQVTDPQGVWRRWRDQIRFEKACRAGLRRAGG
ncbi:MAG: hypothetical protein KG028_03370 [Actinobacteria bacterium]|jgi:hypothetical protein|nr:hypothetical protein [Actinomycetota bacterium]